jgi:hypothetical protein
MNSDVIESVLHEILDEQKETLKLNRQLVSKIENLSSKLENHTKEMSTYQNTLSEPTKNTEIIAASIENIKQVVATQHNKILHEKRLIIFPEFKSPECYRLLFNCIIYLTIATYSFLIIKVIVDHWCR